MHDLLALFFGENLDRTAIWTAAIALVTLAGFLVAWRQLTGIRATSRADFTFRFIESFFTPETRNLFLLLMNSALTYDVKNLARGDKHIDRLPYLKVDGDIMAQLAGLVSLPTGKKGYSSFEIDDLLLGHFESLGWYVKRRLISFDAAYVNFSYYLIESYEHPEIVKYLSDPDNVDTYEDFPYLYRRFKSHSEVLGARKGR